jgi:hypothetical protein
MPRIGDPVRALLRLDDRVLGRLYGRPTVSVRAEFALAVAVAALAVLFAVATGELIVLMIPVVSLGAVWCRRACDPRRSR